MNATFYFLENKAQSNISESVASQPALAEYFLHEKVKKQHFVAVSPEELQLFFTMQNAHFATNNKDSTQAQVSSRARSSSFLTLSTASGCSSLEPPCSQPLAVHILLERPCVPSKLILPRPMSGLLQADVC